MTKQELVTRMQEGNAWIPGKKVKLDFGSEGAIMLDGAGQSVSEDNGDADTTIKIADEDLTTLAKGGDVRDLYQHGKIRVDGVMRPAHSLGFLKGLA